MKPLILFFFLFIGLVTNAQKLDTFKLNNGETIIGEVLDDEDGNLIVKTNAGKTVTINKSDIKSQESANPINLKTSILSPYFPLDTNKNILYTEVVTVDASLTKEILYNNAKKWFTETFVSGKEVIQTADKDDGTIIGKGAVEQPYCYYSQNARVGFIIKIDLKNGRYKYSIYKFRYSFDIVLPQALENGHVFHPKNIDEPFEDWAIGSKRYVNTLLSREKEPDVTEFYKAVSVKMKSMTLSLKKSMATKTEEW